MAEKCEGTINYFRLSKEKHTGPYSNSKPMPMLEIGIIDERGLHKVKLPIGIPNDPFSVKLIESELVGQKAAYEEKFISGCASGPVWSLQIHSGKFEGVHYTLEELADF